MKKYIFMVVSVLVLYFSILLALFRSPWLSQSLLFYRGCSLALVSLISTFLFVVALGSLPPMKRRLIPSNLVFAVSVLFCAFSGFLAFFVVVPCHP